MVGRCAVPGCKTTYYKGNQKENEVTLFTIPKTSLSKWQELIPCSNLTSTSLICYRHFDESDFKSGIEIFNVFHPFQRRHLNAGAIPKHFLINDTSSRQAMQNVDCFKWRNNLNVEANASNASVRKRPKVDKIPTTTKRKKLDSTAPSMEVTSTIQETIDIHQAAEEAIFDPLPGVNENVAVVIEDSTVTSPSMEASSTNFKSNFVTFQSLVTLSMIPKNWIWSFDQIKQMIYCISMDQLPNGNYNVKSVHFQNKQEVMYYVNGKNIPSSTTALSNHFRTVENITQLIKDFNDRKICSCIPH
ncbi:uncharacterized protein LOC124207574 [Daphnia pulex]|uniref:uncharacterized protein LOC124197155 n=1 Tax=Daphnia pulex TaxID=6669 RepID=UPI001EDCC600|nr:uncharacterized protein LOC124197155 [Daphnia pulex]XP_046461068.1 uncharacterized protein LOC124207574 [Daphnia pulex]